MPIIRLLLLIQRENGSSERRGNETQFTENAMGHSVNSQQAHDIISKVIEISSHLRREHNNVQMNG